MCNIIINQSLQRFASFFSSLFQIQDNHDSHSDDDAERQVYLPSSSTVASQELTIVNAPPSPFTLSPCLLIWHSDFSGKTRGRCRYEGFGRVLTVTFLYRWMVVPSLTSGNALVRVPPSTRVTCRILSGAAAIPWLYAADDDGV